MMWLYVCVRFACNGKVTISLLTLYPWICVQQAMVRSSRITNSLSQELKVMNECVRRSYVCVHFVLLNCFTLNFGYNNRSSIPHRNLFSHTSWGLCVHVYVWWNWSATRMLLFNVSVLFRCRMGIFVSLSHLLFSYSTLNMVLAARWARISEFS